MSTTRAPKDRSNLHLVLTQEWWRRAATNEKLVEYRLPTLRWMKQIFTRRDEIKTVTFARAYTRVTITRTVEKIDLGPCPLPGWADEGDVIRIHYAPAAIERPFRAGDIVLHEPSNEEWVLACDEENGHVFPSGWPPTRADAHHCIVTERASADRREEQLRAAVRAFPGDEDPRGRYARAQLEELAREACEKPSIDPAAKLIATLEMTKAGFAGCLPDGRIVDRRIHPTAIPMQENSMLGIPAPKPTP